MDYQDYEIVVSDNFSAPDTAELVHSFNDPRIQYIRTDRRLNMADHWQFAYEHSRGKYAIILGDDDGIVRQALNRLHKVIEVTHTELITWKNHTYWHPDWPTWRRNSMAIDRTREIATSLISAEVIVNMAQRLGHVSYPAFPHGSRFCISRSLAGRIIKRTGRLFDLPYPDFTSGLYAVAELGKSHYGYYTGFITFTTYSQQSNAAAFLTKDTQRLRNYIAEFTEPLYQFTPLQTHTLWNGHAECVLRMAHHYYKDYSSFQLDYAHYLWLCHQAIMKNKFSDPFKTKSELLHEFNRVLSNQSKEVLDEFKSMNTNLLKLKRLFPKLKSSIFNTYVYLFHSLGLINPSIIFGDQHQFSNLSELCKRIDPLLPSLGFTDTFIVE